jgi:alpha-L-fucosidase
MMLIKRFLTVSVALGCLQLLQSQVRVSSDKKPEVIVKTNKEALAEGEFSPSWESLRKYEVPEWFKDAKFGIWAHWGPQCEPESGDWYARNMYYQGHWQYNAHLKKYGHPSEFGFKDVIHAWKAEKWNPQKLVSLYKRAGARYFFAMANHHDNMDLWNSKYQPWNSVNLGPKKDIIKGWAKAAKKNNLPFGVSVHSAHAWIWYESARGTDKTGEKAGIPYDGNLTKEDGKGTWWEGYDPQDLYVQDHPHSDGWDESHNIHEQWNWWHGASLPDQDYCDNFYNRTMDLIEKYQPDLLYFDDTALPLWPVSDAGLKIVSNFYNLNKEWHNGQNQAVVFGKILTEDQRDAIVWDIEKGATNEILPYKWQCCSCIGAWHYDRGIYERDAYKDAQTVIQLLADVVSKNGNLLLNIPVRGNGSIDEKEEQILENIAQWMKVNNECIFGTRPWKIFGEGPTVKGEKIKAQGFNERKAGAYSSEDIRFTVKDKVLYAIVMDVDKKAAVNIKSLAKASPYIKQGVVKVKQLGTDKDIDWTQDEEGLSAVVEGNGVVVLKIDGVL